MLSRYRDDILDYEGTGITGKTVGNDIKEKKITLPLDICFRAICKLKKKTLINIVRNKKKTKAEINEVIVLSSSTEVLNMPNLK